MSDVGSEIGLSPLKGLAQGLDQGLNAWRAMQAAKAAQESKENITGQQVAGRSDVQSQRSATAEKDTQMRVEGRLKDAALQAFQKSGGDLAKYDIELRKQGYGQNTITPQEAQLFQNHFNTFQNIIHGGGKLPDTTDVGGSPLGIGGTSQPQQSTGQSPSPMTMGAPPPSAQSSPQQSNAPAQPAQGGGMLLQSMAPNAGPPQVTQPPIMPPIQFPQHDDHGINAALQAAMNHPSVLQHMQTALSAGQPTPQGSLPTPQQAAPGTLGAAMDPNRIMDTLSSAGIGNPAAQGSAGLSNAPSPMAGAKMAQSQASAALSNSKVGLNEATANRINTMLPAQLQNELARMSRLEAETRGLNYMTDVFKPAQVTHMESQNDALKAASDERVRKDTIMQQISNARVAAQERMKDEGFDIQKANLFLREHASDRADVRLEMARQMFPLNNIAKAQHVQQLMQSQANMIEKQQNTVGKQINAAESWLKANSTNPYNPETEKSKSQGWYATQLYNQKLVNELKSPQLDANGDLQPSVLESLGKQGVEAHSQAKLYGDVLHILSPSTILAPGKLTPDQSTTNAMLNPPSMPKRNPPTLKTLPGFGQPQGNTPPPKGGVKDTPQSRLNAKYGIKLGG